MEDIQFELFCQLIPTDRDYPTIEVKDGEPLIIGRSPLTKITDGKCSRNQLEVLANFETRELTLKQLGTNPSIVAKKPLNKHETYILGNMGSFEVVRDKHKYHVNFGKRIPQDILKQHQEEIDEVDSDESETVTESKERKFDSSGCDKDALELPSRKLPKLKNGSKTQSESFESPGAATCDMTAGSNATKRSMKRKRDVDVSNNDDSLYVSGDDEVSSKRPKLDPQAKEKPVKKNVSGGKRKAQQASLDYFVSSSKSSNQITPDLLDSTHEPKWEELDTLLVMRYGSVVHSTKIASFDLDSTLIETASGRKFATGPTDWKFMKGVLEKLRSLHVEGYKIVIFTNQAKLKKQDFHEKIGAIASQVRVPMLLMASLSKDRYRKPCTGMWEYLVERENGGEEVDMETSFYVGDAAGRLEGWRAGAKKDFACTDRKFAANLQLSFMTPEEYFLGHSKCTRFSWGEFNPKELDYSQTTPLFEPTTAKLKSDSQEVVLFVGCPASGKSTFYTSYMKPAGYIHINRDKLKTWQKCVTECDRVLKAGKSAVIDNTNPDKESRLRYISCAKKNRVPIRCFQFMTTVAHAKHNNRFRELTVKSGSYVKVNDMVFNMYKSKFTEPERAEGFVEIVKVTFNPVFSHSKDRDLYKMFLL